MITKRLLLGLTILGTSFGSAGTPVSAAPPEGTFENLFGCSGRVLEPVFHDGGIAEARVEIDCPYPWEGRRLEVSMSERRSGVAQGDVLDSGDYYDISGEIHRTIFFGTTVDCGERIDHDRRYQSHVFIRSGDSTGSGLNGAGILVRRNCTNGDAF